MNADQIDAFKARVEALAASLGIGMEAAALIVELHDVAHAFHRVADEMGKPHHYEMDAPRDNWDATSVTIIRRVTDA